MDHMALLVGHDLEFNVPGGKNQLFQIHLAVTKAGHSLRLCRGKGGRQLLRAEHPAHAATAAAGAGLQQHRVADALGHLQSLLGAFNCAVGAGHHRHSCLDHQFTGGGLVAHLTDHIAAGADELEPALGAQIRKFVVFGKETVAGVDGLTATFHRCGQDGGLI